MLGTRKFRIGERMEARRGAEAGGAVLTPEDLANLDGFVAKVSEAVTLLNQEIAAIGDGRLGVVSELFDQKAAILKWLELRMPLVEPFLKHPEAQARQLPGRLAELQQAVAEDSALLSRMATAAGTIVREIEKATNRNSLNGLYGKSGQKIGNTPDREMRIDREF